ncbi:MAG TPA: hypothetical protein VGW38_06670 [Chloroflexota bacterium]|nr:hypothetical protein [Chloroflexota bacterium]
MHHTAARTSVFVGGPIKAGFRGGTFDGGLRALVHNVCGHLQTAGYHVWSAHIAEDFSLLAPHERATVAERDYAWMVQSDVYLALLPLDDRGLPMSSIGTGVEIGWATVLPRPCLIAIDMAARDSYSPFVLSLVQAGVGLADIARCASDQEYLLDQVREAATNQRPSALRA